MILKGDEFISFFFYKTVTTVILYNILEYIINLLYLKYEKSNNIIRECEYEITSHRNF